MLAFSVTPVNQNFQLDGVRHVLPADAYKAFESNSALAVDVREEHEIIVSAVDCPQLLIFPWAHLEELVGELPANTPLVLICNHGIRSVQAVDLLQQKGFTEVYNLDGGLHAWIEAGLPVAGEGGCSCGGH
ncbi:MAG: hypothetical protein A2W93_01635 [Bacteroidetes bacterium GWF2_43_63]|nr:MAG: hypothetical protein A2W94_10440 [Bacteroidetes bacterium GWE2_42_42]OFY55769.1 MAG: hypothetical protein A2W93_01635 [Bacteroidetes bacterium GWF2_43_63]HBG71315.1 rhodanese-like domain-containing protein [Bacteroidales bacterium]HCB60464.1 rhodanese-like domain-containing protein [Bacteroidales bacterium]HCY22579.1 rhodanese-like domain-containing protein [Bacteroidales bacterium]